VRSNGATDDLVICSVSGDAMELIDVYHFDDKISSLAAAGQTAYAGGKSLHVLSIGSEGNVSLSKSISWNMNQIAQRMLCASRGSSDYIIASSVVGRLVAVDIEKQKVITLVKGGCTSFDIQNNFLLWTSANHFLTALPFEHTKASPQTPSLRELLNESSSSEEFEPHDPNSVRAIDRGSLIVSAVSDDIRVVLQAPRGNLEDITPRVLLLDDIFSRIEKNQYGEAFRLSRRQHINLAELLVNVFADKLTDDAGIFVRNVSDPGYLNVFIASLMSEKVEGEKRDKVCKAFFSVLDGMGDEYITPTITSLMTLTNPNIGECLRRIQVLQDEKREKALDFLLVICKDAEKVFEQALGTYELGLASMVVLQGQLDPKECSALLKRLHQLPLNRRKFEIDVRLKNFSSALKHLYQCEVTDECVEFAEKHKLFEGALKLFRKDTATTRRLRNSFAHHLSSEQRFLEAATFFSLNSDFENAGKAYLDAGEWRMALSCYSRVDEYTDEDRQNAISATLNEVEMKGNPEDTALILTNWIHDHSGALKKYIECGAWYEAVELFARHRAKIVEELGAAFIESALDDAVGLSVEMYKEMWAKVTEKGQRLKAVRMAKEALKKKVGERNVDEETDSDVFTQSNMSTALGSDLTNFTFGQSSVGSLYTTSSDFLSSRPDKSKEKKNRKDKKKRIREVGKGGC